jgi:hypothetical protein
LTGLDPDGINRDLAALQLRSIDTTGHRAPGGATETSAEIAATIEAPAAELDLWLWRRCGLDRAVITGDRALIERLPNLAETD